MLNEHNLPQYFLVEAVNTTFYFVNRTIIRGTLDKTPYSMEKSKT